MEVADRCPAPKRVLALDGGDIRGVVALEILDRLQTRLRTVSGDDELVLADAFDYVVGTSTGVVIAAGPRVRVRDDMPLNAATLQDLGVSQLESERVGGGWNR